MCSAGKLNNFLPPLVKICPVSSKENVCTKKWELASLQSEYETGTICHTEKRKRFNMKSHFLWFSLADVNTLLCGPSLLLCPIMLSEKGCHVSKLIRILTKAKHSVKQAEWKRECENISNLNASLSLSMFSKHFTLQYIIFNPSSSRS